MTRNNTPPLDKSIDWFLQAISSIFEAGGNPSLLDRFPRELLDTFIRNDLHIVYKPKKDNDADLPTVF